MSLNEMKELYQRSVTYQFIFFFYSLIVIAYTIEPMMLYLSLFMLLFNAWLMIKTIDEYTKKKALYTNPEP